MSAADALKVAIRTLDGAAYKCGKVDGSDEPSMSLQVKYAASAKLALDNALAEADAAQTAAYAEGRKDELEHIAERLLPGSYYIDPPDGGGVALMEQLERMAQDAARYRFVRCADTVRISHEAARDPMAYDAAIDAAIAKATGEAS